MTRTAIRHTLSALAAVALVSVFVAPPGPAEGSGRDDGWAVGMRSGSQEPAAQQGPQGNTTQHYQFRWFQDYGAGVSQPRRSGTISDPGIQKGLSLSDDQ
jgi:hypothetical protein